jgi:hypothetical protein
VADVCRTDRDFLGAADTMFTDLQGGGWVVDRHDGRISFFDAAALGRYDKQLRRAQAAAEEQKALQAAALQERRAKRGTPDASPSPES